MVVMVSCYYYVSFTFVHMLENLVSVELLICEVVELESFLKCIKIKIIFFKK